MLQLIIMSYFLKRKCCVQGCEDMSSSRVRFPKDDPIVLTEWIERSGNTRLATIPIKQLYSSYVMCLAHFNEDCLSPGTLKKLKRGSIPTQNLPQLFKGCIFLGSSINTFRDGDPSANEEGTIDYQELVGPSLISSERQEGKFLNIY